MRGDYSPMEEDFFLKIIDYCLKIRKLKLRVTIQNLNQFFMNISSFEIIKSFYIVGVLSFKLVTTIFPQLTSTHIRNRKYHCLKILLLQYRYLINLRKEMKLAITYIIEF